MESKTEDTMASGKNLSIDNPNVGVRDNEQSIASGISQKAENAFSAMKEKADNLPGMLADQLESGADALRESPATSSGLSASASAGLANDSAVSHAKNSLANGMQSGADWLRDADLDKIRDGVRQQVNERPVRTLFIALGLGYALGKIIRR